MKQWTEESSCLHGAYTLQNPQPSFKVQQAPPSGEICPELPENRGSPPHSPVVPDSSTQSSALGPGFLNYLQWLIHVCLYRVVSVWRCLCVFEPISLLLAAREGCWLCLIACFRYLYVFIILLAKRWRCRRISEGSSELADLVTEGPETVPVAS